MYLKQKASEPKNSILLISNFMILIKKFTDQDKINEWEKNFSFERSKIFSD